MVSGEKADQEEKAIQSSEWIYQSKDIKGRVLTIEVERLLRFLDDKFKLGYVHEETGQ